MIQVDQWSRCSSLLLAAAIFMSAATGNAQQWGELAAFGVEAFGPGANECPGEDLNWAKNDATHIHDGFDDIGYTQTEVWYDQGVDRRDWTHGVGDHIDPYGTDFADVVFYAGHGLHRCDAATGFYWSRIVMGDDGDNGQTELCEVYSTDIRFGNGGEDQETDILIMAACETMHLCVWENDGYESMDYGAFNQINGYHGISYDSETFTALYDNYVRDSAMDRIGENWVDTFTDFNWFFSEDQCATSMVWCSSASNCDTQFTWGGFKDFYNTGSHTMSMFYYICDCNPDNGEALGC